MTKTFGHLDKSLPNSSEFSLKVEVAKFFSWNSQMLAETCALAKNIFKRLLFESLILQVLQSLKSANIGQKRSSIHNVCTVTFLFLLSL